MTNIVNDEEKVRLKKLAKIRKSAVNPYPSQSERSHTCQEAVLEFDELSKKEKVLALVGRLRSIRLHGGSCFANIEDDSGKIQIFFGRDTVGEKQYDFFQDLIDIGDFVQVRGTLFATKRGEKTLQGQSVHLLAKATLPLPEKWHGLSDVEIRYRQRYLDLLANPEVKYVFQKRSLIVKTLREFFHGLGYMEVETPALQPIYGGGLARPFKTKLNALDIPLYLRISDEMYLKRLIVGGYEKVFEICKDFRNEGMDYKHNPEFTVLEAQTAYTDYKDGMDLIEECHEYLCKKIENNMEVTYQGYKISFARPWKRMTMAEAVKEVTGFDYFAFTDVKAARTAAANLGIDKAELAKRESIGEILSCVFDNRVEATLIQPTIIYNHPVEISPLAKKCPEDPRFTERFEHFMAGREMGNNYSELNDPVDLKQRFLDEKKKIKAGFDEAHQTDNDYLEAIKHGMPPTCGIGFGIDRLVMLFTDSASIKEVIFFPTLRPEGKE